MRQEINLFDESLRPKRLAWSAKHLLQAAAVLLLCLFVREGIGVVRVWQLNRNVEIAKEQLELARVKLAETEKKYPRPQEDERLVQRIKQLEQERVQKQNILSALNEDKYENTRGFAEHLSGLSRQHLKGVWLTQIKIKAGGEEMGISGASLKPELVPKYLQGLSKEPSFIGKEFRTFQLSRTEPKNNWVDFNLSTQQDSGMQP